MRNTICEELNNSDIGKLVNLCGWVDRRRDHGGVIFIDLRDHSGFLQITINPDDGASLFKQAETLRNETVIMVSGIINEKTDSKFKLDDLDCKIEDLDNIEILDLIEKTKQKMKKHAQNFQFEEAALLRDQIIKLNETIKK